MTDLVEKLRKNIWFAVNHPHLRAVCDAGFEAANEIERLRDLAERATVAGEEALDIANILRSERDALAARLAEIERLWSFRMKVQDLVRDWQTGVEGSNSAMMELYSIVSAADREDV